MKSCNSLFPTDAAYMTELDWILYSYPLPENEAISSNIDSHKLN